MTQIPSAPTPNIIPTATNTEGHITKYKKWPSILGKIHSLFHKQDQYKALTQKLYLISSSAITAQISTTDANTIQEAKWFLENVLKSSLSFMKKESAAFARQLLAARLHLPVECLEQNPDFEKFVKANYLMRTVSEVYRHEIKYDPNTYQIQMKCNGKYEAWSSIKTIVQMDEKSQKMNGWCYLEQGLTKHNPENWEKLVPYKILPENERPKNFQLEIVTDCFREELSDQGTKFEDHTWIRLKKPSGEVYSVGFYPEDILTESATNLLATTRGIVKCPDPNEFLPQVLLNTYQKDIDEETFNKLQSKIENQEERNSLKYSIMDCNCTDYAIDLAQQSGIIGIEANTSLSRLLPKPLRKASAIAKITPKFIKKAIQNFITSTLGRNKLFIENQLTSTRPNVTQTFSMQHPRLVRKWIMNQKMEPEPAPKNSSAKRQPLTEGS